MPVTVVDTIEPKNEAFIAVVDAHRVGNGDVTNTELSYLNSVTSNVQDQLDAKHTAFEVGTGLELTTGELLVDSQETTGTTHRLGDNGGVNEYRVGQSFQLAVGCDVTHIEIYFSSASGSPTGNVTVKVETDSAGLPSGVLVDANATIAKAGCVDTAWEDFIFPAGFTLAPLTTYWIVVDCDDQAQNVARWVRCKTGTGGSAFKLNGVWYNSETNDNCYRIYADVNNLHTLDSEIVHDSLSGFVADEHIDHTTVSITAGTGLTGGGTIAANRTLALSHLGLQSLTAPGADRLFFWDHSALASAWLVPSTGLQITGTNLTTKDSEIAHDSLSGYSANKHIDHTAVSIATAAAGGLSGGGDIGTTRNLVVDISGLTAQAAPTAAADYVMIYDAGEAALRKVLLEDLPAGSWENPMIAAGDMVIGGASGAPTRLAAGTNDKVLTMVAGAPAWATATGGAASSEREIINPILAAYMTLDHTASAYQLLCDSIIDAMESEAGVDTATSTYESYDSTNDWYSPGGSTSNVYSVTGTATGDGLGDINNVEQRLAQGFTPAADISVISMTIAFVGSTGSPSGQVTLRIETDNAGAPSGTLVDANATKAITPTASANNLFTFPATIPLSNGVLYWFVLACSAQATNVRWGIDESSTSEYAGGGRAVSSDGGSTWAAASSTIDITGSISASPIGNMVLQSNAFTAVTQPDDARIVILERDVDAITLNTDLKAWASRDGGTTFTQITLADKGNFDANLQILYGTADISGQPAGTSIKWKITTHNLKTMRIRGVGLLWE